MKRVYAGRSTFSLENQILGDEVTAAITRVRIPATWEALAKGERVSFGDIVIDASSITVGQNTLTWDQVEKIDLNQGVVRVRRHGGFLMFSKTAVAAIPDLRTFLRVSEELQTG